MYVRNCVHACLSFIQFSVLDVILQFCQGMYIVLSYDGVETLVLDTNETLTIKFFSVLFVLVCLQCPWSL